MSAPTDRDYFPQARLVELTAPPADAPTMADVVAEIALERAA